MQPLTAARVEDGAVAVAAFGLPGSTVELPPAPLAGASWRALLSCVRLQRLQGHLLDAINAGALPVTDEQARQAAAAHLEAMGQVLVLERVLLLAAGVLERADIPVRVLKGPAVAHLDYPDTALRVFGDIDLLVPSARFEDSVTALGELGYTRMWPQLRPGFDRRFGKGATLVHGGGLQIDLHRTFVMGPFGLTVDTRALFDSGAPLRIGGRDLQALSAEERFLHACYNAALGDAPPRFVPLRDVAQMVLANGFDETRALALAGSWSGQCVVARAVRLAWERFHLADAVPLSVWALRYEPSRGEERTLSLYTARTAYGRKALGSLRVIPGMTAKGAFLRAVAVPDREFLMHRGRGTWDWMRQGSRKMLARGGQA